MINQRILSNITFHKDFDLIHKHYTLSKDWEQTKNIYPFGVGQVSLKVKDSKDFTSGSVWFVNPKVEGVREVFDRMTFEKSMGVVMSSLSKSMIIEEYCEKKQ